MAHRSVTGSRKTVGDYLDINAERIHVPQPLVKVGHLASGLPHYIIAARAQSALIIQNS